MWRGNHKSGHGGGRSGHSSGHSGGGRSHDNYNNHNGHYQRGYHRRRTRSTNSVEHYSNDHSVSQRNSHWNKVGEKLNDFRLKAKFCDVKLKVGDRVFEGHKLILASSSLYFEGMFAVGCEKDQVDVEINGVSANIFQLLFDYIYTGDISVTQDNVQDLLAASSMLQIDEVKLMSCDYLRKQFCPSNAIGIYKFADFHCCNVLRLEAKRYIERYFAEVIKEDEFLDLPCELLKSFLRSEGLSIDSEFQLFDATIRWILHDSERREDFLTLLIAEIRLPLVAMKTLDNYVDNCENRSLQIILGQLLDKHKAEVLRFHAERRNASTNGSSPGSLNMYHDIRWSPRMSSRKSVYVIGGISQPKQRSDEGQALAINEKLDIYKSEWKPLPPMKFPRSCHGVTVLNNMIYVVGGECAALLNDSVEVFDPIDNQWSFVASMNHPKSCFGLCSLDGYIYALGGLTGMTVSSSIERFDSQENSWREFDNLPTPRCALGVVAHEGLIYIIGGFDENGDAQNTVISYNPVTKEFQALRKMQERRAHFGMCIFHDNIYVVGGTTSTSPLNSVERYSIHEDVWTPISNMKIARISPCVASVNDTLLVIGGRKVLDSRSRYVFDSVELYDPELNKWRDGVQMPTSRYDAVVAVI